MPRLTWCATLSVGTRLGQSCSCPAQFAGIGEVRMPHKRTNKRKAPGQQYAALPCVEIEGETRVMLVTSRETGRWVLPKGWAEKGLSGPELAGKEAFEEAGVLGEVGTEPVGSYTYPNPTFPLWAKKTKQVSALVF